MLNEEKVLQKFKENYQLAFEEEWDNPSRVAWEWTEDELLNKFGKIKDRNFWGCAGEAEMRQFEVD